MENKKVAKKKKKKIIFELNYIPEKSKEMQKTVLFELVRQFSSV